MDAGRQRMPHTSLLAPHRPRPRRRLLGPPGGPPTRCRALSSRVRRPERRSMRRRSRREGGSRPGVLSRRSPALPARSQRRNWRPHEGPACSERSRWFRSPRLPSSSTTLDTATQLLGARERYPDQHRHERVSRVHLAVDCGVIFGRWCGPAPDTPPDFRRREGIHNHMRVRISATGNPSEWRC